MSPVAEVVALPPLPNRSSDGHKGTFGRVLIVAGSRGMSGAAVLAGLGALRGGAGLVQVAAPREVQPTIAAAHPCYLTEPLSQDDAGRLGTDAVARVLEIARRCDAMAIGPGLGCNDSTISLVASLLPSSPCPLVLDADGLNALAQLDQFRAACGPATILTPHPGEFARLLGVTTEAVVRDREALAIGYARSRGGILVLKGHRTLVTDGSRLYRNDTGNPGLARGGSGDVLTGLLVALLGQGMDAFGAARLGVHLHGLAGDLACARLGADGMLPVDLVDDLPTAWRRLRAAVTLPSSGQ